MLARRSPDVRGETSGAEDIHRTEP